MGKKLLVADDSVTIQKVIKLALSSEGYDILAVSDGKEAIKAIEQERPDVVLIDVALPLADAYAVKRAINEHPALSKIGFILLASAFERVDEQAAQEVGFSARLVKPFDPSHLRKAVAEHMAVATGVSTGPATGERSGEPSFSPPPPPKLKISSKEGSASFNISASHDLPPVQDMYPTINAAPPATPPDFSGGLELKDLPPLPPQSIEIAAPIMLDSSEVPMGVSDSESETEDEASDGGEQVLENDIKDLTESTIKLSGLDDFQWNLDDGKKMRTEPKVAPPPPPSPPASVKNDHIERTLEMVRPSIPQHSTQEPTLGIDFSAAPQRGMLIDNGGSTFPLPPVQGVPFPPPGADLISGRDFVGPKKKEETKSTPPPPQVNVAAAESPRPISRMEMEQIIREEVRGALEKIARESLPQIAEAVIRQEIEKILAEP